MIPDNDGVENTQCPILSQNVPQKNNKLPLPSSADRGRQNGIAATVRPPQLSHSSENNPRPTHRRGNPCGCPSPVPRHHTVIPPKERHPVPRYGAGIHRGGCVHPTNYSPQSCIPDWRIRPLADCVGSVSAPHSRPNLHVRLPQITRVAPQTSPRMSYLQRKLPPTVSWVGPRQ